MKVEVAALGSRAYGFCGRKATLNQCDFRDAGKRKSVGPPALKKKPCTVTHTVREIPAGQGRVTYEKDTDTAC